VTGGSGFIGTNLVRELESRGHDVWICDLMHCEKDKFVRCDVGKYRQMERLFETQDSTTFITLAAEYGRWNGEDYYENLWMTNAIGQRTCSASKKEKVQNDFLWKR